MAKLTIQDIAKVLTEKSGLSPRQASKFAAEMFAIILERLQAGEQVKVKGLGTFKVISVEPRESVNVRTGERILIEGHDKVTFTPDTLIKELVNKPFSQFETVVLNDGVAFDDEQNADKEEPAEDEEENLPLEKRPLVNYVTEDEPVIEEEPVVKEDNAIEFVDEEIIEQTANDLPIVDHPIVNKPVEEEPVVEEPPVEEPKVEEPSVEESVIDDSAEEQPVAEDVYNDDNGNKRPWVKWLLGALLVLVLMLASAYVGYRFAIKEMEPVIDMLDSKDAKKEVKAEVQTVDTIVAVKDTVNVSEPMEASQPVQQATPVETVKPMEVAKPKGVVKSETVEAPDPYAAKDERVRLGAYRIVGTLNVITVQPGQTFYSICKGNLGPDMECYVEVYNDFPRNPQIKVGQKIKIPKLELKKKGKR